MLELLKIRMGNQKNKRKPANHKIIEKTQQNMAKDAEELSVTDEEVHADATTPSPPPAGPSTQNPTRDSSSEEDEGEDDVSGEHLARGAGE